MKNSIITLIMVTTMASCSQNLKCKDFHEGLFLVLADSIYSESSEYYRNGTKHVEWSKTGDSLYANVRYLDDCNWILTYDKRLNELDAFEEFINASGGIHIETMEISGDTLRYIGILKNDTVPFVQPGSILKLN